MVFSYKAVFAFGGRKFRIEVFQLLRGYKGNGTVEFRFQLRIVPLQLVKCSADGCDNTSNGIFEIGRCAVLLANDLFPVPLIHVNRV